VRFAVWIGSSMWQVKQNQVPSTYTELCLLFAFFVIFFFRFLELLPFAPIR